MLSSLNYGQDWLPHCQNENCWNQEVFAHGDGDPDAGTLPLYDSSGQSAGYIQRFNLVTMSPGDTLVTFVNRQTGAAQHFVYLPLIVKNERSAGVR